MKWGRFSRKGLDSIANSTARLNFWHGAVRSSKTVCSVVRWLDYCQNGPPGDLLMVGKTERTLKRNILDLIEAMVGPKHFKLDRSLGELRLFNRRIYLAGANDERAQDKIRGMTVAGVYGDEVSLWPSSFFKMMLSRMSVMGAKGFFTTNPDSPFHWLKVEYLDRKDLDLWQEHFELTDNLNLDPAYVESLKKEYTGVWFDRMIRGLWVLAEGLIYSLFGLIPHGYSDGEEPTFDRQDVAIDYGTQNAFAALLIGSKGDSSWVRREYFYSGRDSQRQKTDAEYSADLKKWLGDIKPRSVIIDPSAASMIEQLKRDGFRVKPAKNSVVPGISTTATRLAGGKLKIHRKHCPNLVKEFGVYAWDAKAGLKGEDKPLKANDHALDALRYHQFTLFGETKGSVGHFEGGL